MNKLIKQSSFTVIAPIISGCTQDATRLLDKVGDQPSRNGLINFGEMESVHFASMLILPSSSANDRLLLETNYDGPLDLHLDDLIQHAPGLNEVFQFCLCFPSGEACTPAAVKDYLVSYSIPSDAFHVAFPGRTVADIKNAIQVSRAARDRIAERGDPTGSGANQSGLSEEQLRNVVAYELRSSPTCQQPLNSPTTGDRLRTRAVFNIALIVTLALLLFSSLFLIFKFFLTAAVTLGLIGAIWLAVRSGQDAASLQEIDPLPHVDETEAGVDPKQNHMCAFTPLKPGLCRLLVIKGVLFAVKVACKWVFIRNKLGPIGTIHFARWIVLDKRQLLFLSNYDGTWASYLGDFADQRWGVNAIWSNTIGFPPSKFIYWGGAQDLEHFQQHVRQHLVRTPVFYGAYAGESVQTISRFLDYRDDIARRMRTLDEVETCAARIALDHSDVQGVVASGYDQMNHACFVLLRIQDPDRAQRWLEDLVPKVTSAERHKPEQHQVRQSLNVAFTYAGLERMGVPQEVLSQCSEEFRGGMTREAACLLLGDPKGSARENWDFGKAAQDVHILIMLYARNETDLTNIFDEMVKNRLGSAGLEVAYVQNSERAANDRKEPFGFRDGISQPAVIGLSHRPPFSKTELIKTGEFLLGHENEYGQIAPVLWINSQHDPDDLLNRLPGAPKGHKAFGYNGSYLVVRKLEQDVCGFRDFLAKHGMKLGGSTDGYESELLAARMVGRWPSGAPLTLAPYRDVPALGEQKAINNQFRYRPADSDGAGCPIAAHVRRANPRDSLDLTARESLALSKRHRIIRRGRCYSEAPGNRQGLFFIAINSDLRRQFEFVQQAWLNNPQFMGHDDGPDPIASSNGHLHNFTLPAKPFAVSVRGLASFVTLKGGAYFFLPGIKTLRFLAAMNRSTSGSRQTKGASFEAAATVELRDGNPA
jgi:Dyp-type peroxidase family